MIKEFYTKALPESGVYCIATIDPIVKLVKHKFVENLVDLETFINEKRDTGLNIFVALSSFSGYSRKADEAKFVRSFFVDLDVGEGKGYDSKESALKAADQFILENNLPPPVKIDSGTGIHLYWLFDRDIPAAEWKPYAEKFKDYCISRGLNIDPVVTADLARILRCPDTFNHKTIPPTPTLVLSEEMPIYVFDEIKEFLGEVEPTLESILQSVPKGLSEDQRKALKLDNFESNFGKLVEDSEEGKGCAQIAFIMENVKSLPEPLWYSGLSIAQHCVDKDTAIHLISKEYPNYNEKETIRKAQATQGMPHSCETFNNVNPGVCEGCPHRGKVTNPLALGKVFKIAVAEESTPIEQIIPANALEVVKENTVLKRGLNSLPEELFPYVYGIHGGIYWTPPDKFEEGKAVAQQPILVSLYDLYPLKRIYSPTDGDCLLMKAVLPRDPEREFILPMRFVYASEKLREIISSQGVLINPDPKGTQLMMNYIIKWGHYLMTKNAAEIMRMQMGWTDNHESFVVGETEIMKDGQEISSPTSPLCRGIAKHLNTAGSFNDWKIAAEKLNKDSLELHAFTLLTGFGSILMNYTSTSGVTVCLTGESGAAKTGALYSCLSVWGNPKDLSVLDATENGMTGRYLGLHNIPFGLDEVGNMLPKTLSQLIHKISQGKSKIRMQASVNAERDHEMSASLIAVFTSNHSLYDKLTILKKDPNGEVARLIEFAVRKPQAFNDDPTLGKEIFDKFRFNYGWAGREFIRVLFKYTDDDIKGMMDKWVDRFRKDFGEDTAYRFYENLIAASLTGGQIAAKAGIVQYDLDKVYKKIVGEMVAIRDNVVKVNAIDYEALIGEFINMHQTGILAFKDGKTSMEPRSPLVIRAEVDSSLIFISKPEFRKFLSENMVSSREFVFQMQQAGIDVKEARKRMGTGWKDATGGVEQPDGSIIGGNKVLAMDRAMNIIHWQKHGTSNSVRVLSQIVPFMNAYIQGMDILLRSMKGEGISGRERKEAQWLFVSTALKLSALATIYSMAVSSDEEYQKLDDRTKVRSLIIPGTGFKIPVSNEVAMLTKAIPELGWQYITRADTNNPMDATKLRNELGTAFVDGLGSPNLMPQGVRGIVEVATNHNFLTGNPIVGRGLENLKTSEQFTENTSELAKLFGQTEIISPLKLDHLLKGYGGTMASGALYTTDAFANLFFDNKLPTTPLHRVPLIGSFMYSPNGKDQLNDYYDLKDRSDEVTATLNKYMKFGTREQVKEFAEENRAMINIRSQINQIGTMMKTLREQRKRVIISNLSSDEKRAKIDELDLRINKQVETIGALRVKAGL